MTCAGVPGNPRSPGTMVGSEGDAGFRPSILKEPTLLIVLPLLVIALRRWRVALVVVVLILLLRIGLRAVKGPHAAGRRIARHIRVAVGRIDIAVVGSLLRHDAASAQ